MTMDAQQQPERLYVEPTSACNLRCSMCFRNSWFDEEAALMPEAVTQQVRGLPAQLPGLRRVMFSGMGEPLLHPEIGSMVRSFAEKGIETELLTNATLLDREKAQELLSGGLNMLWVSVDGFTRSSYERVHIGSQFDTITEHLRFFDSVRGSCQLGLTFVITHDNLCELDRLNAFADRFHADCINLSYAVPCEPVTQEQSCYELGIPIGKQHRLDMTRRQKRQTDFCPFIMENGCFIKWNGDICPCMQLLHSCWSYFFEEKRKITAKCFGNLTKQPLREIWQAAEYADFRSRVRRFEFSDCTLCLGCEDRLENRTDCMYNPFPTCGACLWAQGVGRCP